MADSMHSINKKGIVALLVTIPFLHGEGAMQKITKRIYRFILNNSTATNQQVFAAIGVPNPSVNETRTSAAGTSLTAEAGNTLTLTAPIQEDGGIVKDAYWDAFCSNVDEWHVVTGYELSPNDPVTFQEVAAFYRKFPIDKIPVQQATKALKAAKEPAVVVYSDSYDEYGCQCVFAEDHKAVRMEQGVSVDTPAYVGVESDFLEIQRYIFVGGCDAKRVPGGWSLRIWLPIDNGAFSTVTGNPELWNAFHEVLRVPVPPIPLEMII
jgi:hypothetical protein